MKGRVIAAVVGMTCLLSLLLAASASAAPGLGVELSHYPTTIYKNDAFLGYEVDVQNSGDAPTSGTVSLSIELPQGLTLARAEGTGWTCAIEALTCTSVAVIAPGASFPVLDFVDVRIDASAELAPIAKVTAQGGGAAAPASDEDSFVFAPAIPFGLRLVEARATDEAGVDMTQAGSHPYEAFGIFETTKRRGPIVNAGREVPLVVEDVHGGLAELPVGVVGNPEAAGAVCKFEDLNLGTCPAAAAVGGVEAFARGEGVDVPGPTSPKTQPVYRLEKEPGYPASFGFQTESGQGPSFVVRAKLRSDGDYGITTLIPLVPQEPKFFGANFAFCGFGVVLDGQFFERCKRADEPDANTNAFITLGTNCASGPPVTRFAVDSWLNRGRYGANGLPDLSDPNWKTADYESPPNTGCVQLTEEWVDEKSPSFTMQPGQRAADSPAGYTARLHVPQDGLEDPNGLGTSHLKDTTVTLPAGISFNPSIASGLEACSLGEIGYLGNNFPSPSRIRFDATMPRCPQASKLGTAEIDTPLLADRLRGSVYLAAQNANPFGSDYAMYIAIEEDEVGVVAKLAGRIDLDPVTGQISATFKENPQIPFEDLDLNFFGGERAALANPVTCGSFGITGAFSPWSAVNPDSPRADEIARTTDPVQINQGANGTKCVSDPSQRPFAIGFDAGSANPVAGAKTPFSIRITRPDGSQELDRLEIAPPPGFVASLRGVPYCSEAQIAAATVSPTGKAEQLSPSCPKASEIGSVLAGAGPGANPFYVPGKLYLAGPYKGAPLSVVAITPAVAGPFDLGNVVIRSALKVNPVTARITAVTDPLPQIFEGIPLRLRDVRINLDRPNWAQNPTNCSAMAVDVTAFGASGAVSVPSNRFQVGGCDALAFKPKLKIEYRGQTKRTGNPALRAVLTQPGGQANISRTQVILPKGSFIDNAHINNPCTRAEYAANACPAKSILGRATAWSPLLDEPLSGFVYFRSNGGERDLPDIVAKLQGQVEVELVGYVDSVVNKKTGTSRVRNTFAIVPDAPVSRFELNMKGGKLGLIENSKNLCKQKNRATVKMGAHNGLALSTEPVVKTSCGKKAKKRKK